MFCEEGPESVSCVLVANCFEELVTVVCKHQRVRKDCVSVAGIVFLDYCVVRVNIGVTTIYQFLEVPYWSQPDQSGLRKHQAMVSVPFVVDFHIL